MTFMEKLRDHINGKSYPVHVKTKVSFISRVEIKFTESL